MTVVKGYCPMGCGETLFIGPMHGYITCSFLGCPNAGAVTEILAQPETEHIVTFEPNNFTILHPLRERLGDQLTKCRLHLYCAALLTPLKPGRYRAYEHATDSYTFVEVS